MPLHKQPLHEHLHFICNMAFVRVLGLLKASRLLLCSPPVLPLVAHSELVHKQRPPPWQLPIICKDLLGACHYPPTHVIQVVLISGLKEDCDGANPVFRQNDTTT